MGRSRHGRRRLGRFFLREGIGRVFQPGEERGEHRSSLRAGLAVPQRVKDVEVGKSYPGERKLERQLFSLKAA